MLSVRQCLMTALVSIGTSMNTRITLACRAASITCYTHARRTGVPFASPVACYSSAAFLRTGAAQLLLARSRHPGTSQEFPHLQHLWRNSAITSCRAFHGARDLSAADNRASTDRSVIASSNQRSNTGNICNHYDVLVVGLGAYGSSVLYHLAKAGLKVLGVERHHPVGHSLGSSHGASRIIRLAYFEGLQYGPLLKRSLRLFLELQDELAAVQGHPLAEPLFMRTGMLDVGSVFPRSLHSAQVHGLQHEVLTGAELNRRFPAYQVPGHWQALYQPDGGVLAPERIVQAHVLLAQRLCAHVLEGHSVTGWGPEGGAADSTLLFNLIPTAHTVGTPTSTPASAAEGCVMNCEGGGVGFVAADAVQRITATAAVLAPGPWMGELVPELRELCVPERQVVGWFDIKASHRHHFSPDRFPVFVLEEAAGGAAYYGFPEHGALPGFKIGLYRHLREEIRDPADLDRVRRTADAADESALRAGVASYFPAAAGRLLSASACFFTNTPDGHFLVDRHPRHPQVILCSACSGHGFKMCSGIGQLIARMVLAGPGVPRHGPASLVSEIISKRSLRQKGVAGWIGGDDDNDCSWGELLPFRFDAESRPGHREALARFN